MIARMNQTPITSGQARKGMRVGHPELSVECPQCHSAVGRRCLMRPGLLGITHAIRQITYRSQSLQRYSASAGLDVSEKGFVR
jgi:hypothetical protein